MGVQNIKIEPMTAIYGEDTAQEQTITCKADVADSLDGLATLFYDVDNTAHYWWFNTSGGSAVDPAIPGATAHAVALTTGASATAVATALAAVLTAVTGFNATASGKVVTLVNTTNGYAIPLRDPATGGTGFGFKTTIQGDLAEAVGCVEGEIPLTFNESLVEVKCHDTGATVITKLKSGWGAIELKMNLQETTLALLKKMFVKSGGSFLPVGAGATELFGIGNYKQFENAATFAKKLTLHPKRLLDNDFSEDWTVWKAYPKLEGATFSGEKTFTLPVTFEAYLDETKPAAIQYFAIGDSTQTIL